MNCDYYNNTDNTHTAICYHERVLYKTYKHCKKYVEIPKEEISILEWHILQTDKVTGSWLTSTYFPLQLKKNRCKYQYCD